MRHGNVAADNNYCVAPSGPDFNCFAELPEL